MINDQNTKTNEIDLVLSESEKSQTATLYGIPWFLPVYYTPHMHKTQVDNDSGTFQISLIKR